MTYIKELKNLVTQILCVFGHIEIFWGHFKIKTNTIRELIVNHYWNISNQSSSNKRGQLTLPGNTINSFDWPRITFAGSEVVNVCYCCTLPVTFRGQLAIDPLRFHLFVLSNVTRPWVYMPSVLGCWPLLLSLLLGLFFSSCFTIVTHQRAKQTFATHSWLFLLGYPAAGDIGKESFFANQKTIGNVTSLLGADETLFLFPCLMLLFSNIKGTMYIRE